jgi:hypothetical protein
LPLASRRWQRSGNVVAAASDQYELHFEDETHLEPNPYLGRVWHRRGEQPTVPAVGTNRRVTVFGSVEALGRGRVEVVGARQDSAGFERYLAALETRHQAIGKEIYLGKRSSPLFEEPPRRACLTGRGALKPRHDRDDAPGRAGTVGERVSTGQLLGRIGNTGGSFAPHLHFHLADGLAFYNSNGLPFVFDRYTLVGTAEEDPSAPDVLRIEGTPQAQTGTYPLSDSGLDFR